MPDFTACSSKHKSCSPFHADLVRGYQRERERQETLFDEQTAGHDGDKRHAKDTGHQLITFGQWLAGHQTSRET